MDDQPDEEQRADLARRLRAIRFAKYQGERKRAYTDVGVNPATWSRGENGQTLKERSLSTIVRNLWPETDGDWTRLDPPLGSEQGIIEGTVREHKASKKAPVARGENGKEVFPKEA